MHGCILLDTFAAINIHLMRKLILSNQFYEYYSSLQPQVQEKFDYVMQILINQTVISTKFAKRIQNTNLYEMRVSVGYNEYRTLLFTIDHDNIMSSKEIILLNAFLKKSNKDYKQQLQIAQTILNDTSHE